MSSPIPSKSIWARIGGAVRGASSVLTYTPDDDDSRNLEDILIAQDISKVILPKPVVSNPLLPSVIARPAPKASPSAITPTHSPEEFIPPPRYPDLQIIEYSSSSEHLSSSTTSAPNSPSSPSKSTTLARMSGIVRRASSVFATTRSRTPSLTSSPRDPNGDSTSLKDVVTSPFTHFPHKPLDSQPSPVELASSPSDIAQPSSPLPSKSRWARMGSVVRRASSTRSRTSSIASSRSERDSDSTSLKSVAEVPVAIAPPRPLWPSPIAESPAREAAALQETVHAVDPSPLTQLPVTASPESEPSSPEVAPSFPVQKYIPPPLLDRVAAGPGPFTDEPDDLPPPQVIEDSSLSQANPDSKDAARGLQQSKERVIGVQDANSHGNRAEPAVRRELPQEENPENVKTVVARLAVVFGDVQQYRRLLSCRSSEAQRLLDTFQMLLDTSGLTAEFRRNLLVATQRLSKRAELYPTCYNLQGVEWQSEFPVAAGSFADIYKGRLLGQIVCMKVIRLYQTSHVASFLQQFSAEAILWGQLLHANLLPIYGLYRYTTRLCLVSPWMEHGDVISFLLEHPDADRSLLVSDVTSGVDYLHKHDIVHGDLKGANILVNDSMRACVADFGLSAVSDANILHWTSHSSAASKGGSVRWQAPELFDFDSDEVVYNSKPSDVYAVSCVAYEIFTSNVPFFEIPRDPAVMRKVQMGAQPSRPPDASPAWGTWGLTEPLWSLMATCWRPDPKSRPTMDAVASHFSLHKPQDDRPLANVKTVSRARFRDSVNARSELPSMDEVKSILNGIAENSLEAVA